MSYWVSMEEVLPISAGPRAAAVEEQGQGVAGAGAGWDDESTMTGQGIRVTGFRSGGRDGRNGN
jgi:hypothetical protein